MLRCAHQQSAWLQTLFYLRPKLEFPAQTCHGAYVDAALQRFDAGVVAAAGAATGLPLQQVSSRTTRRLALPARLLRCGLRKLSAPAPAAFTGMLCRVVPMLIDRTVNGEELTGFLHHQLAPLLGQGLFDDCWEQNRCECLLRSVSDWAGAGFMLAVLGRRVSNSEPW